MNDEFPPRLSQDCKHRECVRGIRDDWVWDRRRACAGFDFPTVELPDPTGREAFLPSRTSVSWKWRWSRRRHDPGKLRRGDPQNAPRGRSVGQRRREGDLRVWIIFDLLQRREI